MHFFENLNNVFEKRNYIYTHRELFIYLQDPTETKGHKLSQSRRNGIPSVLLLKHCSWDGADSKLGTVWFATLVYRPKTFDR